jgi:hypothetical protein
MYLFLAFIIPNKGKQIAIRTGVGSKKDADYVQLPSVAEINHEGIV